MALMTVTKASNGVLTIAVIDAYDVKDQLKDRGYQFDDCAEIAESNDVIGTKPVKGWTRTWTANDKASAIAAYKALGEEIDWLESIGVAVKLDSYQHKSVEMAKSM